MAEIQGFIESSQTQDVIDTSRQIELGHFLPREVPKLWLIDG